MMPRCFFDVSASDVEIPFFLLTIQHVPIDFVFQLNHSVSGRGVDLGNKRSFGGRSEATLNKRMKFDD